MAIQEIETIPLRNIGPEIIKNTNNYWNLSHDVDEESWNPFTIQRQGNWLIKTNPSPDAPTFSIDSLKIALDVVIHIPGASAGADETVMIPYLQTDEERGLAGPIILSIGQVECLRNMVLKAQEQRGF